ncbi:MAG: hypothetical protein ACRC5T_10615 [Cetobacterium sp.]
MTIRELWVGGLLDVSVFDFAQFIIGFCLVVCLLVLTFLLVGIVVREFFGRK